MADNRCFVYGRKHKHTTYGASVTSGNILQCCSHEAQWLVYSKTAACLPAPLTFIWTLSLSRSLALCSALALISLRVSVCVLWEIISLIRYPTAWCGSERTTALLLIKVILKHLSLPLFGPCVGARVRDFWAVDVRRLVPDSIVSLLTPLFAGRQKSRIKQKPPYHSHTQKPTRWQRKQKQTVRPPCARGGFASTLTTSRAGPGFSPTCSEKTYRFGIVFFFFFPLCH